jgi:Trypsin-like peptidase domain
LRCRFATAFCFSLIAVAISVGPARSQDAGADDSLRPFAVHVGPLYGVYLGNGFVITAAHVVGPAPHVEIAGESLPTRVVKRGDFNDIDLALLSIDEHKLPASLRPLHMSLCQEPLETGRAVIVAIPEGIARSYVMSPSLLPRDLPATFQTAIRYIDRYIELGSSGSGVFDAKEKCLLGIISRKITVQTKQNGISEPHDIARYFVPASEIAKFMPPEARF